MSKKELEIAKVNHAEMSLQLKYSQNEVIALRKENHFLRSDFNTRMQEMGKELTSTKAACQELEQIAFNIDYS